ncbi:MAG: hypothetical protein F7B61_02550 [Caldisphaeraceae archaeon]|nr:hypothetical protein [Caldisphaeraceae archaeon]
MSSHDDVDERVVAIKRNALKSFSGLYLLLEGESVNRFMLSFPELIVKSPENACNLAREILGSSFMFVMKTMLKGEELRELREYVINACMSSLK